MKMCYFWLLQNQRYGDRVLVQIGTQFIDQLVTTMTKKELQKPGKKLETGTPRHQCLKRNTVKGLNITEYDLEGVKGKISTMTEVMIPPFGTIVVKYITNLITHSKCMSVVVEPVAGYSEHIAMARS